MRPALHHVPHCDKKGLSIPLRELQTHRRMDGYWNHACRFLAIPVLGACFYLSPASATADGIIQKLPPDGQWSRYDLEFQVLGKEDKPRVLARGSFTIRSVGRKVVNGEVHPWIELEWRYVREKKMDSVEIYQLGNTLAV